MEQRLGRLQNGCSGSFLFEGGFDSHAPPPPEIELEVNGLSLLARGALGTVVLDGSLAARPDFGIELANVTSVRVEGFMVREYHEANIALRAGADDNVIRGNAVTGPSDHNGIALEGAHANTVEDNTADGNGGPSNGCGIDIFAGASNNMIRNNVLSANARAGVRVRDAGAGNVIVGNVLTDGGANGVINQRTSGTHIEGNRALHHVGIGERTGADAGAGIRVLESDGAVVIGNEAFDSADADLLWDEQGAISFRANRCLTASPQGLCAVVRGK